MDAPITWMMRLERGRIDMAVKLWSKPGTISENDWVEDFHLENGNYLNRCIKCGCSFIGYKRRVICKACYTSSIKETNK